MTVHVDVREGLLTLRPTVYDERVRNAVFRRLPSAVWSRGRNRWESPATRGALCRLGEALVDGLEEGRALLSKAASAALATATGAVRPADSAAPLPFVAATEPWRHQRESWHFLGWAREHLGAALLDCGMRTGKTRMVLDHLQGLPADQRRALVLAPKVVVEVWPQQAARHCAPGALSVVPLNKGSVAQRVERACELLLGDRPTVVVMGWSVLERLDAAQKRSLRSALAGATLVADEVHYAKSAGSGRSQALAYISRGAAMRIGASGTPLAHSPLDAYGVFRFLDPGVWGGSFARFRDYYAVMGGYGGHQVLTFRNLEDLAARMRPYTYRATREVLDLIPAEHIDVPVELPDGAKRLYLELRDECVAELRSGTLTVDNALSKLVRLSQLTSGYLPHASDPARREVVHSAKQEALTELLQSCNPTEPWVVFGRFHHDLDAAMAAAAKAGRPAHELSGRARQLDAWRAACAAGRGPLLAAQLQAGGIGIDLTEAAYCALMSVGYSLSEYEQAVARVHGPDQRRTVGYYHLVCRGTVDVDIRRALKKRRDVLAFVAEAMIDGRLATDI